MFRIIFALALAAIITGISPVASAAGVQLKGETLVANVSGKKFTGLTGNGATWETTYSADGKMQVAVASTGWSDIGTWQIKDDLVCSERTRRSYTCYEVFRISDNEYNWVDDRGQTTGSSGPK